MLISSIKYNSYNRNQTNKRNVLTLQNVNFFGAKKLQPIDTNAFKTDGAKILYAKIKRYLQIIGNAGSVKDIPLTKYGDVFLSIDKGIDKTKINIAAKNDISLVKANFNKDGQMIVGDMGEFHFERTNKNKRTLATSYGTYKPHGYNDKEWGMPDSLLRLAGCEDNPIFEVFLELTRLYTSIFK